MNTYLFQNHFFFLFPELFFITSITLILIFGVLPFKQYNQTIRPIPATESPTTTMEGEKQMTQKLVSRANLMWPVGWLSILTLFITLLLNLNIPLTLSNTPDLNLLNPCCELGYNSPQTSFDSLDAYQTQKFSVDPYLHPETTMHAATTFNNTLIFDHFTCLIKSIILLSALGSILISFSYIRSVKINSFEYFILILFSTFSMLLIVSSYDMISMYLAIELQSLAFYVLAAFKRNSEFSTEAGLKYFILGALSSGMLLLGQSFVYGFTGITQFEELSKLFVFSPLNTLPLTESSTTATVFMSQMFTTHGTLALLGLLFILFAFLFKISAVPFHMWTPDVYEGAPTSVTAFFSITPKIAILALLLRLCLYSFYDLMSWWQSVILICALLSMFIGTFGALNQNKIKRLFAYSSIAHVGYLLIGLGTGTIEAVESILIYIIVYIITALNVFAILLVLHWAKPSAGYLATKNPIAYPSPSKLSFQHQPHHGSPIISHGRLLSQPCVFSFSSHQRWLIKSMPILRDSLLNKNRFPLSSISSFLSLQRSSPSGHIKFITDLAPLARSNPLLAITFALILFSNAGVPPLAGFYGKLNIFLAAIEASMFFIAIAGIVCSVIGAFYSIRLVKILYFHRTTFNSWPQWNIISRENALVLAVTFFFTLFFFLKPSFLFIAAHHAALALCI